MARDVSVDATRSALERVLRSARRRRPLVQARTRHEQHSRCCCFLPHYTTLNTLKRRKNRCVDNSDAVYRQAAHYLERHQIGSADAASQFVALADKVPYACVVAYSIAFGPRTFRCFGFVGFRFCSYIRVIAYRFDDCEITNRTVWFDV